MILVTFSLLAAQNGRIFATFAIGVSLGVRVCDGSPCLGVPILLQGIYVYSCPVAVQYRCSICSVYNWTSSGQIVSKY